MSQPGVHRLRPAHVPGRTREPRSLVVGRYQPLADGSGCLCFPLPDQTCLLQSLQKTKRTIGKICRSERFLWLLWRLSCLPTSTKTASPQSTKRPAVENRQPSH